MTKYFPPKVDSHSSGVHADWRARLATQFLERWGCVMAEVDGEDSAGRQKVKLMAESDVVARACSIAEIAVQAFEERGWIEAPTAFDDALKLMRIYNRAKSSFHREDDEEIRGQIDEAKAAGLL